MIPVDSCVLCLGESGLPMGEALPISYKPRSVGFVKSSSPDTSDVFMIGMNITLLLPNSDIRLLDPAKTGKGYDEKTCNRCHVLKPIDAFAPNQRDARGNITRRPTCRICRRDIDRRQLSARDIREANKHRPAKGTLFQCPICRKRSIVGITAKIVLDHHKGVGRPRSFICDSCNTGLGRFQNGENLCVTLCST